jgi:hypothetical protein
MTPLDGFKCVLRQIGISMLARPLLPTLPGVSAGHVTMIVEDRDRANWFHSLQAGESGQRFHIFSVKGQSATTRFVCHQ